MRFLAQIGVRLGILDDAEFLLDNGPLGSRSAGQNAAREPEDVLNDLEGPTRRMLDYCGLPFESACFDFHKADRAVRTASNEQVPRPINRKGLDT